MIAVLHDLGSLGLFIREIWRTLRRTRGNLRPIIAQMSEVSYRSISTVAFAGVFTGAILVLQFNVMLAQYDAQSFLGGLNTSALVREVGPLIISFLLAGKIGAFTAAELGTMRVTEQIDAIECLGVNPLQYLVLPRFVAIVLSSALLLILGLIISIAGSMVVASSLAGINFLQFIGSIPKFTTIGTLLGGLFKCLVYGLIVAGVSCHKGFNASGGARGVGRAVTMAAVYTNLYIIIGNFATSQFIHAAQRIAGFASEALR